MKKLSYIFLDVDGTLTDGKIYYSEKGDEQKAFHIKDGLLLAKLAKIGYVIVIVTGRNSKIVTRRMQELGVNEIYQGVSNKAEFITKYLTDRKIERDACCYIGDDLNDIAPMKLVGYRGCPADACEEVKKMSDYVSNQKGGDGAVRDVLEYLLKSNGEWEQIAKQYDA